MTVDVATDAPDAADEAAAPTEATFQRRRLIVLLVAAAVIVGAVVAVIVSLRSEEPPRPTALPVEAWVPYWALEDSLPDLAARAESFRELSPFWFAATGAGSIVVDEFAPADLTDQFMSMARDADVPIVPSIADQMPAGGMAGVLADPTSRAEHIDALVTFAEEGDYAGLDLDYEQFAFADDRSTWSTTRPNWVTFITELAERLHADGRTLTVSIPPVYDDGQTKDSGYWGYDYGAIAPVVDRIRVMAYDYSTATAGPVSPLPWVEQVIAGVTEASDMPEKLVLGIPLYGYNWPVTTLGDCPPSEEIGRTSVTMRSVDDLAQRRAAVRCSTCLRGSGPSTTTSSSTTAPSPARRSVRSGTWIRQGPDPDRDGARCRLRRCVPVGARLRRRAIVGPDRAATDAGDDDADDRGG